MLLRRPVAAALLGLALIGSAQARNDAPVAHHYVQVQLGGAQTAPVGGRLLLFVTSAAAAKAEAKDGKVEEVDVNPLHPDQTLVAAREVARLAPGDTVSLDADDIAFPGPLAKLPAGDYLVQAVLDANHNYNYSGRGAGDVVSEVTPVHLPAASLPVLQLSRTLPAREAWTLPPSASKDMRDAMAAAREHAQPIDFVSPALSAFWGRPIHMRGWVLLPPDYEAKKAERYPVVYYTHGFGGGGDRLYGPIANSYAATAKGEMPPMIWVFLDESSPTGTHEFADSVNNGPWGKALTEELIPSLEKQYRMDGKARGRFLNGHSSGGWATLWLQTHYPAQFGGTWSTSPDPVDFHDFSGVNLYSPHVNLYRRPDGTPWPIDRVHFHAEGSFEDAALLEQVLGPYGGQLSSYEWVFSPRGADGTPMKLFDRATGEVDADVRDYWIEHYDIAHYVQQHWPSLKADLDGKIHIAVGTDDTWYLDGAVHKFKMVLDNLHARADIRFLPNKAHMDLYAQGNDPNALLKQMAWEMYAVARPDSPRAVPTEVAAR